MSVEGAAILRCECGLDTRNRHCSKWDMSIIFSLPLLQSIMQGLSKEAVIAIPVAAAIQRGEKEIAALEHL